MRVNFKRHGRPSNRPTDEVLEALYEIMTAPAIGKKYGVTEATVRNWLRQAKANREKGE